MNGCSEWWLWFVVRVEKEGHKGCYQEEMNRCYWKGQEMVFCRLMWCRNWKLSYVGVVVEWLCSLEQEMCDLHRIAKDDNIDLCKMAATIVYSIYIIVSSLERFCIAIPLSLRGSIGDCLLFLG